MLLIMALSDRVYCMEAGKIIGVISIRDVLEEFAMEIGAIEDLSQELDLED